MENFFGYSMGQGEQPWRQSSPSTAGSTVGKSAVVVEAVVNTFWPDGEMGVRKVRARWSADFIVKRGLGLLTVFLAWGAIKGQRSERRCLLGDLSLSYLIRK